MLDKDSQNEGRPGPSFQEFPSGLQSLCNQLPLLPTSSLIRSVNICICFISNPKARSEICFWQGLSCDQDSVVTPTLPTQSHSWGAVGGRGGQAGDIPGFITTIKWLNTRSLRHLSTGSPSLLPNVLSFYYYYFHLFCKELWIFLFLFFPDKRSAKWNAMRLLVHITE